MKRLYLFVSLWFTSCLAAQTLAPGNYIITVVEGGMALTADQAGMNSNDGRLHLSRNTGGSPTQVWNVAFVGSESTYSIVLTATRKALDADGPGMHNDGGLLHLWDYNRGKTQLWHIRDTGDNTWAITLADGGKAVDAAIASMYQEGGLVHLWSPNLGKTQRWYFTRVIPAPVSSPTQIESAPLTSSAELDEFNRVANDQAGVGVLGGDTTLPFFVHPRRGSGEDTYKYQKLIDTKRVPEAAVTAAAALLENVVVGFTAVSFADAGLIFLGERALEWATGDRSSLKYIDCWFPVQERKVTVCGQVKEHNMCKQDYLHTKVTVDKDYNIDIKPSTNFTPFLKNPRLPHEQFDALEGEVRVRTTGVGDQQLIPADATLLQIPTGNGTYACMHGPWMADILEFHAKVPIPATAESISIKQFDFNTNNEIHPVNQLWYRTGVRTDLWAFGDGSGYFDKIGNNEFEASGLNHPMRFYVAFHLPAQGPVATYDVDGINYNTTTSPLPNQPQTISLTLQNKPRLIVKDSSNTRDTTLSHKVFFDKVRRRSDGSVQGYIVIETVPIVRPGGLIHLTVQLEGTFRDVERRGR